MELNGLLEHSPDDRLITGWCGQRAQVAEVVNQFLLLRKHVLQADLIHCGVCTWGRGQSSLHMTLLKAATPAPLSLPLWEEAISSPVLTHYWVWRYGTAPPPGAGRPRSPRFPPRMGGMGAKERSWGAAGDKQPPKVRGWESHLNHECQHCILVLGVLNCVA